MSSDLHLVLHQQDKIQLMEHFNEYVYQLKSVIDTQFSMTDLRAEVEDLLDDYNRMLHFFACSMKFYIIPCFFLYVCVYLTPRIFQF